MIQKNIYKDFKNKINLLKKDTPFLATITFFSKSGEPGKELETFVFVNNFPYEEIEGTKNEIVRQINGIKR